MSDEKIFRLKTFHGTKIFYDGERGVFHAAESEAPRLLIELAGETATMFASMDDRKIFFSIDDGGKFIPTEESTGFKYIRNDDGTISILRHESYLSALDGTEQFGLMPHNITWEHFTLEPLPIVKEPIIDEPKVFWLRTFHKTRVFYSSARSIYHAAGAASQPVCAQLDGDRLILFVGDGADKKYLSFDASGKIILSDEISSLSMIRNSNGTITIVHAKKFLSARRKTGAFAFQPKNLSWEHFTLEVASDPVHWGGPPSDQKNLSSLAASLFPKTAVREGTAFTV